ncbi:MAG: DUF6449 domain-containing protein [Lachnospiraceae bacterium]|nr:DUF6449 domain-containing protein [Lachnospiraceae bacterium]
MTSKISFFKLVRGEMYQMSWLTAVQMVAFVLFLPFRALMSMAIRENQLTRVGTADYSAVDQFARHVGLGHTVNNCLLLGAGAVCALTAFAYLYSQVKQDFYHSLSLKREELFAAKYVSSTLTFVIAYLPSQALVLLVGLFYQALTGQIAFEIALATLQGILFFLCSYSTTLAAMMLAGNLLTAILAVGAFALYLPVMKLLQESLGSVFLNTKVESRLAFTNSWMRFTSPWAWCLYSDLHGAKGVTGRLATAGDLCQLVVIAAALTLVALALYRIRKTEVAGSALAFRYLEPVIKLMVTVPVGVVAGLIAYEMAESVFFEVIFILLFGVLASMVIELIYRVDIRQVFSHMWQFPIAVVISCAIFFVFRFDLTGYNSYLPAQDEIAYMSVSSPSYNSYVSYDENGDIIYASSERDLLDQVKWEDFGELYELAEDGVEKVREYGLSSAIYNQNLSSIYIKYYLKNGKEVYRYYHVNTDLYCEVMNELIRNEEFRNQYFSICSWDEEDLSKISGIWVYLYGTDEIGLLEGQKIDVDKTENIGNEETEPEESLSGKEEINAGETDHTGLDEAGQEEVLSEEEDTDDGETEHSGSDEIESEEVSDEAEVFVETFRSIDISVPISRLSDLVEAYREDLKTVSFEDIYYDGGNEIYFYIDHSYRSDMYSVSKNFKHTMALLKEIYEEQMG